MIGISGSNTTHVVLSGKPPRFPVWPTSTPCRVSDYQVLIVSQKESYDSYTILYVDKAEIKLSLWGNESKLNQVNFSEEEVLLLFCSLITGFDCVLY